MITLNRCFKMKTLLPIIGIAIIGCSFTRYQKLGGKECMTQLHDIFNNMYTLIPKNKDILFVNYEITTCFRNETNPKLQDIKKTDIKMYSTATNYWFISNDISVYQDKKYTFTVIPMRKVIYWADRANDGIDNDKRMNEVKKMQDTLFKTCVVKECVLKSTEEKVITMVPEQKYANLLQIESVTYYLNPVKQQLLKQHIEYTKYKKLKYVEYVFKQVNATYKGLDINAPVKGLFLTAHDKLNATYSGYTLINVKKEQHN